MHIIKEIVNFTFASLPERDMHLPSETAWLPGDAGAAEEIRMTLEVRVREGKASVVPGQYDCRAQSPSSAFA